MILFEPLLIILPYPLIVRFRNIGEKIVKILTFQNCGVTVRNNGVLRGPGDSEDPVHPQIGVQRFCPAIRIETHENDTR